MKKCVFLMAIVIALISCEQQTDKDQFTRAERLFWGTKKYPVLRLNEEMVDSSSVCWSTGKHTAQPVPIGAVGPEFLIKKFKGMNQNTEIADVMKEAVENSVNVILVIGDGMGIAHMSLPIFENIALKNQEQTYFEKIMEQGECGFCLTNMYDELCTGSAAAVTAIACGQKTYKGMIGIGPKGDTLESSLKKAENHGYVTGLITDTRITHATPAGFYGNVLKRSNEQGLAEQLLDYNQIEVLFGGGARFFIPESTYLKDYEEFQELDPVADTISKRKDKKNLLPVIKEKGYQLIVSKKELEELSPSVDKVFGLFNGDGLRSTIDRINFPSSEPSLESQTEKMLEILSSKNKNLLCMIECGRIDWEAHQNDMGAILQGVKEMDRVLKVCYEFYEKNPNTLLIFTADHETGGLGLSYFGYPKSKREKIILASGDTIIRKDNSLSFEDFLKLNKQKKSIEEILKISNSTAQLKEYINQYMYYSISDSLAKELFELKEQEGSGY